MGTHVEGRVVEVWPLGDEATIAFEITATEERFEVRVPKRHICRVTRANWPNGFWPPAEGDTVAGVIVPIVSQVQRLQRAKGGDE